MVGWRVCLFVCLSLSLLLLSASNSASLIFISWTGSLRMGRCLDLFVVDDVVVVVSQTGFYITRLHSGGQERCRAATFLAVAEIPAWRKVRKAFYGLAKFATVCSNLTKLLSGFVRLGEVCRDFTVFTETSAQCAAKGVLRSDSLKLKTIRLMTNFNQ